jgi:Mn-dependent DtxR family transcriptional regulator
MEVRAQFLGEDGSLGLSKYRYYTLTLEGSTIVEPIVCPYGSVEAFLRNWQVARTANKYKDARQSVRG